jgi:hypothetical protein
LLIGGGETIRNILFGILISMLLIGTVFAGAMPTFKVKTKQINNFDNSFEFSFNSLDYEFGIESTINGEFATVVLLNEGFNYQVGKAKLPLIRRFIEIPQNAEPEILIDSVSWQETSLIENNLPNMIIPSQFSVDKIPEPQIEFLIDEKYYSTNRFLPEVNARIKETGEIRGRCFALIEISPIKYNPSTGELKLMDFCTIKINLPNSDMEKTYSEIERYSTPSYERLFKNTFENYGIFEEELKSREQEGYLIIVYDDFNEEIQPFVSHKESKGFEVTTTKTSDIPGGATKEKIYDYIEDAYDSWTNPPAYVLLVGDTPQIPTYFGSESDSEADLYYVTVDGSDYIPDIYIGRFPGSTESHIEAMVEKTIFYEEGGFISFDWIKNATFIASSDHGQLAEETHNYVIDNFLAPNGYTCEKIYESQGGNTNDITNAINVGTSLCIYSGHGYSGGWSCVSYGQTDINNLENAQMYPFVCSHACSTNPFGYEECFGETWLRVEDKGALAFWGASASTLWDEDDILEKAMFQSWWKDNLNWIGGMTDMALIYLYENYSGGGYTQYYFEAYNLNGDPSVRILTDHPSDPPNIPEKPNGPDEWIENIEATFTSSTVDPNGDNIYYLFDWGDGDFSEWLGPYTSGQTVEAEHSWSELGEFKIKVKAKDEFNAQSDWSEESNITIFEDEAPEKPYISGQKIIFGGKEYEFTFTATDPEGHDIYYKVDWDDGKRTEWLGPYSSGETITLDHIWYQKGEFYIKAWAKDEFGKESSQNQFKIYVPISKTRTLTFDNLLAIILATRPILGKLLSLV